jgi:hypothetical protein
MQECKCSEDDTAQHSKSAKAGDAGMQTGAWRGQACVGRFCVAIAMTRNDANGAGAVNAFDIDPFVGLLMEGNKVTM